MLCGWRQDVSTRTRSASRSRRNPVMRGSADQVRRRMEHSSGPNRPAGRRRPPRPELHREPGRRPPQGVDSRRSGDTLVPLHGADTTIGDQGRRRGGLAPARRAVLPMWAGAEQPDAAAGAVATTLQTVVRTAGRRGRPSLEPAPRPGMAASLADTFHALCDEAAPDALAALLAEYRSGRRPPVPIRGARGRTAPAGERREARGPTAWARWLA